MPFPRLHINLRRVAALAAAAVLATTAGGVLVADRGRQQAAAPAIQPRPLRVLFLGSDGPPHPSSAIFTAIAPVLARRGIQITAVQTPQEALDPQKLADYDALLISGDQTTITPEQEKALLDFVEAGKGVVAMHSAGAMFPSSDRYVSLIGGQWQKPTLGDATVEMAQTSNPAFQGLTGFSTSDELVVHTKQNTLNRTVLMERVDNGVREPVTWIRTQGKGRVFYTALGHDPKTWGNLAFQQMLERGLLYAVDDVARECWNQLTMPQVSYVDGFNVPNYENRDPAPKYQMPFTAPDSMKFISVPAEFSLELFASEPDIIKPISFNFDERGRLWIIEAINYPNVVLNGAAGDDRIKILEDTNGDGKADKFTIFADHLNLPTSLTFANGGVIVAAAPNFLFLKDTNGDDRADVKEVLSTGWGITDTHAGPSNLQYGPDNYIWGTVGYSGFDGQMNGKPLRFSQGAYRFKPDGSGFEYISSSTNNTWGLGFSENFDVFGSTANNDPSFYIAIPNRYFEGVQGLPASRGSGPGYQSAAQFYNAHYTTPYIRQVDVQGGYTAAAGHQIYTARAFPKEYWNRIAFISEPTAHLVGQGILEPKGAGFVTRDGWNLVSGSEEWVAPVHAQVGPDGAVWVADWYNFIAQHNPTPVGYSNGKGNAYETSMRDHSRGRIYRVAWKHAPAGKKRSLTAADAAGLLDAIASDNMFWRLNAQRLIVERGQKDVVPQLIALVKNTSVDSVGTNGGALHALWALQGLGELSTTGTPAYRAAVDALKHPAAGVRKAAVMVLPKAPEAAAAILASGVLQDRELHTRLAAVLAVADMPASPEIGRALYAESQKPENFSDRWLSRAFYVAATRHKDAFLTQYKADRNALPFSGLSTALRIGDTKPDWRTPPAAEVTAEWKEMQVPGAWETRGLPDFDGVVWFTRTVDVASPAAGNITLGRVSNNAEVWVNGLQVMLPPPPGGRGAGAPPAAGRGAAVIPAYTVPAGALRAGPNVITVRIQNNRNDGGFLGTPDQLVLTAGDARLPLAGAWKYRVERQTNAGAMYSKPGELAAHVAFTAAGGAAGAAGSALPRIAPQAPDVTLRLAVVPGQLKYDLTELQVAPNQLVEIVFTNPDTMQHNFVLGASGTADAIGAAAEQLAKSPAGVAQQYVPDIPQILFSTKLLDPAQTMSFQFRAPATAGQYPYLCTFPGHWVTMRGTLNVVQPQGRGRGGL